MKPLVHSDAKGVSVPGELVAALPARFRKTATIEAVQWFKMGDHPAVILKSEPNRYADEGVPWIPTLEGGHVVTPGDWIATGAEGEHWPIKPDIFAKTYVRDDGRTERNLSEPVSPLTADLHRDTALLVNSFAIALAHKLLAAQKKYGFTNGWYTDDWEDACRADLLTHVAKGDPLDVAAYAAFCWARGWPTSTATSVQWGELERVAQAAVAPSRNRTTDRPGGTECHDCGAVFIGSEFHTQCGVCLAEEYFRAAATPAAVLSLIAIARVTSANSVGTTEGREP